MTNEPSGTPNSSSPAQPRGFSYPKQHRLLRRSEFREVYDQGFRVSSPSFAAFCWKAPLDPSATGPKFGFTATRALGKAVIRNRMKRRVREQLRLIIPQFATHCRIVFNLRRAALTLPADAIRSELTRLAERCA